MKETRKNFLETEILTPTAQATTNDYADIVDGEIDTLFARSLAIVLENTDDTNDLDWKILGSIDGSTWVEVVAEATVQEDTVGTAYTVSNPPYRHYKVQVKSTVGDAAAEATVHIISKA